MEILFLKERLISIKDTKYIGYCKKFSKSSSSTLLELSNIDEFNSNECALIIKNCITPDMKLQNIDDFNDKILLDKLFEFITFLSLDIKLLIGLLKYDNNEKNIKSTHAINSIYFKNIYKFIYDEYIIVKANKFIKEYPSYTIKHKDLYKGIPAVFLNHKHNILLLNHIYDLNLPEYVFNNEKILNKIEYYEYIHIYRKNNVVLIYNMNNKSDNYTTYEDDNHIKNIFIDLPIIILYDNDIYFKSQIEYNIKYKEYKSNKKITIEISKNIDLYLDNKIILSLVYKCDISRNYEFDNYKCYDYDYYPDF